MLKVSVKIPDASLKAIKKAVERKVAQFAAQVATDAYNDIIKNKEPYWSGEFYASWNVAYGRPEYIRLISAGVDKERGQGKGADFRYQRPKPTLVQPNYSNPYATIYVSNAALHAYKVENIGTPTHPQGGWEIMKAAKDHVLMKYRFF